MISQLEREVTFRFLRTRKNDGFLNIISIFSFIGISLGVAVLIIVMSVMNGFRTELISKIVGFNAHAVVQQENKPLKNIQELDLAKNIVSSGRASNATVQLSYAIGVVEPTSVYVYADGKVRPDLANWIKENVDLSPKGIIDKFRLFELDLTETTLYGHFGRDNLPYERLDLF